MTLGLSMIVKNESAVLPRLLDGIKNAVDEIVIVDTGSTDGTQDIARRYTDKVYSFDWIDDFSAARNFALSKTTSDYWLWLDADDVVPPNTARAIARLMRKGKLPDIIMLPYVTATDENGDPTFSYYRERIIKNIPAVRWRGAVHEAVPLLGSVQKLNYPIFHSKPADRQNGTRNLDIYKNLIATGRTLDPRERYYYARELYFNGFTADAIAEFTAFIDMQGGFSVNKADACLMLSHCYGKLGNTDAALKYALDRFAYCIPDGEGCCRVGSLFADANDYVGAAYWYERALRSKPDIRSGAFIVHEYYDFIPLVWLSVCYDRLGNLKKAYAYHRRAKKLRPTDKSVMSNDAYFAALGFSENADPAAAEYTRQKLDRAQQKEEV